MGWHEDQEHDARRDVRGNGADGGELRYAVPLRDTEEVHPDVASGHYAP